MCTLPMTTRWRVTTQQQLVRYHNVLCSQNIGLMDKNGPSDEELSCGFQINLKYQYCRHGNICWTKCSQFQPFWSFYRNTFTLPRPEVRIIKERCL